MEILKFTLQYTLTVIVVVLLSDFMAGVFTGLFDEHVTREEMMTNMALSGVIYLILKK